MSDKPNVVIVKVQDDSVLFPVMTLICYFVFFPLGILLNIIGLFTGPKRGCFAIMLFLVLLPALICFMLMLSWMGFIAFSIF